MNGLALNCAMLWIIVGLDKLGNDRSRLAGQVAIVAGVLQLVAVALRAFS